MTRHDQTFEKLGTNMLILQHQRGGVDALRIPRLCCRYPACKSAPARSHVFLLQEQKASMDTVYLLTGVETLLLETNC